ncbi:MAG: hypothetical protein IJL64_05745 [Bacteroidales bacterium]|nr:hypothetical protein [Bacteroidales bacterium]MBQ7212947.1 hypothetical protein [Bacteroidales bacterium]
MKKIFQLLALAAVLFCPACDHDDDKTYDTTYTYFVRRIAEDEGTQVLVPNGSVRAWLETEIEKLHATYDLTEDVHVTGDLIARELAPYDAAAARKGPAGDEAIRQLKSAFENYLAGHPEAGGPAFRFYLQYVIYRGNEERFSDASPDTPLIKFVYQSDAVEFKFEPAGAE